MKMFPPVGRLGVQQGNAFHPSATGSTLSSSKGKDVDQSTLRSGMATGMPQHDPSPGPPKEVDTKEFVQRTRRGRAFVKDGTNRATWSDTWQKATLGKRPMMFNKEHNVYTRGTW
jgi:hypothetical protein